MRLSETSTETFFEKSRRTAYLYGFKSMGDIVAEYRNTPAKTNVVAYNQVTRPDLRNLSHVLHYCFERSLHMQEEPLFIFHSNVDRETRSLFPRQRRSNEAYFTITVIGISDPYAEALILSCANHILQKLRVKNPTICINSMGTVEDSREYFTRLNRTIRRFRDSLQTPCQRLIDRSQITEAHSFLYDESHTKIAEHITQTLRILSDSARQHFERVIEYLEAHELQYRLAPELVEITRYGTHTVFEITNDNAAVRAIGGRYDTFSYFMYRRRVPVTSLTITLPEKTTSAHDTTTPIRTPKIFFFHAGEKARLRSLFTLSQLCDANVPVTHRLHHTRVAEQLTDQARAHPYTLIFGQEEVENDVVCLRRCDTRASTIIPLKGPLMRTIRDFTSR